MDGAGDVGRVGNNEIEVVGEIGEDGEDEENEEEEMMQPAGRSRRLRSQTLRELEEKLVELMRRQIELARENGAAFNVPIRGDAYVRNVFKTFLPATMQRRVYLQCIRSLEDAARSVCLFGSPPYPFLLPSDNGMLNATGMSARRVRMAYDDLSRASIVNVAHFGMGQAEDVQGRKYRVHHPRASGDTSIGTDGVVAGMVEFMVKTRVRIRRAQARVQAPPWPRIGETLTLRSTAFARNVMGASHEIGIRVRELRVAHSQARTALIRAECEVVSRA